MTGGSTLQPVVECVALTKVFQDFWGRDKVLAVDGLDLEIRPGEVFGLLGPNGSGKTTTIKILLGLLYATRGAARVFGRPPTETAVKARIGFMPEESYLYRYLNAVETLDYYGCLFKLDRSERRLRTEQLIEMVGLKRAAKRPVGTYSKGMARRIGLAQALINDPDLLILDEPTTGLDPQARHLVWQRLRELKENGMTILLTTHYMEEAAQLCDRLAVMDEGRFLVEGAPADLIREGVGEEVIEIRGEGREAVLPALEGLEVESELAGDTLYIYCQNGAPVMERIAAAGLRDFLRRPAVLEDLFLRLTGRELRE